MRVLEYGGVAATQTASAAMMGDSATVDSGVVDVAFAPSLLVAADSLSGCSTQTDPQYTVRLDDGEIVEDRVATAPGSYTATDAQAPAAGWVMQLVAFSVN